MAQLPRTTLRLLAMDKFPNDPIELIILIIATIGIAGGVFSLWYLAQQMPS